MTGEINDYDIKSSAGRVIATSDKVSYSKIFLFACT
jgi:hypothetical protein